MTERWPSARKYRDVFEEIKTAVTDLTENGMHQPRKAVEILDAQMRESCASLDQDLIGGLGEGLTQMISQMTGRSMGLLGNDMNFLAMASSSTPSLPLPPVVMHEQGPQLNDFEPGLSEYGETELDWTFPGAEFDAEGDCMRWVINKNITQMRRQQSWKFGLRNNYLIRKLWGNVTLKSNIPGVREITSDHAAI